MAYRGGLTRLFLLRWLDVRPGRARRAVRRPDRPARARVRRRGARVDRQPGARRMGTVRAAAAQDDVRKAVGLNLGALIARSWLVGLTILAVGWPANGGSGLTRGRPRAGRLHRLPRHFAFPAFARREHHASMSTRRKVLLGIAGAYLLGLIVIVAAFGFPAATTRSSSAEPIQAGHLDQPAGAARHHEGVLYLVIGGDPDGGERCSTSPTACRAPEQRLQTRPPVRQPSHAKLTSLMRFDLCTVSPAGQHNGNVAAR
jgi:hypothetical protein